LWAKNSNYSGNTTRGKHVFIFVFMKKHYISKSGFEKLKAEWEELKYHQRPQMQAQVATAAAEGDRSENAAYTYGKMKLREIDRRLRKIDLIIDSAEIVEQKAHSLEARFGAHVLLADSQGKSFEYYLCGPAESNPLEGYISVESPMGKNLIGKKAGDALEFKAPAGIKRFTITGVDYE
jgi:transcription elongation factor GreB